MGAVKIIDNNNNIDPHTRPMIICTYSVAVPSE